MEIRPGDRVVAEQTVGWGDSAKVYRVEGVVFEDGEGALRIDDGTTWGSVNLSRGADGYFQEGVRPVSVTPSR